MTIQSFPKDFIWGAATASYQIEGAANAGGRGPSIWDTFSHTPGNITLDHTGDVACDHYHRWREDIALMKQLGLNAYRFSIAWPRILPDGTGRVNPEGLRFYSELVDGLLEAGITPWVTLYHWDLPQPLEDRGGWPSRDIVQPFVEYTDVVTRHLGDRVKHWITLNEPHVFAFVGYGEGRHAPGKRSQIDAARASHHALLAHGEVIPVIRANVRDAVTGITLNMCKVYPVTSSEQDARAADLVDASLNRWFAGPVFGQGYPAELLTFYQSEVTFVEPGDMETIATPVDFLGINNYFPLYATANPLRPHGLSTLTPDQMAAAGHTMTEMGWPAVPQGLADLLVDVHEIYRPAAIYITENGAAFADEVSSGAVHDPRRMEYLHSHLSALMDVVSRGVPLKGYFVWSLLDNFEWGHGYTKRFGIVYVDYETQQRIPKDSYHWYQKTIAANRPAPLNA